LIVFKEATFDDFVFAVVGHIGMLAFGFEV
jgi:hypothetical protein